MNISIKSHIVNTFKLINYSAKKHRSH